METLATLRDLQATMDYLGTIERELANLPPDLAVLDARVKTAQKQIAEKSKSLEAARAQMLVKEKELVLAQRDEERARTALKATTQKTHYAAAIRDLDEKERLKVAVAKPLKALETTSQALTTVLAALEAELAEAQAQFDELHAIFLEEHANQVEGRRMLKAKRAELESRLPAPEVARFHRLAGARQGRAVVPVEGGACSGCNVKLRGPFMTQLKESKAAVACESCQRILFLP